MTLLTLALLGAAASACELEKIDIATPEDVVVAEVVLEAGAARQFAFLHRTLGHDQTVPGATVRLTLPSGRAVEMVPAALGECLTDSTVVRPDTVGSCYATLPSEVLVEPGRTYTVRVLTADGRELNGSTTVPGDFRLARPDRITRCSVAPLTQLPLEWTRSEGAWVYASRTRLLHVRRILDPEAKTDDPLDLDGLSFSATDTSVTFPSQFGLWQRMADSTSTMMLALRSGLPAGTAATVTISAADRNITQWLRRSGFNPSGTVVIPSLHGDGTGVIGSVIPRRVEVVADTSAGLPSCGT